MNWPGAWLAWQGVARLSELLPVADVEAVRKLAERLQAGGSLGPGPHAQRNAAAARHRRGEPANTRTNTFAGGVLCAVLPRAAPAHATRAQTRG